MVALAELVADEHNPLGYITYVFKCLEEDMKKQTPYILCTRYPNWQTRELKLGEVGYLEFEEIRAGMDKWFDGNTMIPYKYNMIQFIRFIAKKEEKDEEYRI